MPPQLTQLQASVICRIKVLSGMNIAEKRLPQDGRINVRVKGEELDIRVSTVPTVYGESVSLRLLTRGSVLKGLDTLGMNERIATQVKEVIRRPHGIMLVTGPTGSGKSTSLYAFLNTINSVDKRIMTVEDPVEYELKGINQVSVKSDIGRTFAHVLRHFLRPTSPYKPPILATLSSAPFTPMTHPAPTPGSSTWVPSPFWWPTPWRQ